MKTLKEHVYLVEDIAKQIKEYRDTESKKPLKFIHGGTNSTRDQNKDPFVTIDTSELNDVIEVNEKERYALVEPSVSMNILVKEVSKYGLIPAIVPEFPGITCGGAINGAALESASFKFGQFNDCCEEYEVILGDSSIKKISSLYDSDLFYGIAGSYGSLALITLIKISLIPIKKYVHLVYEKKKDYEDLIDAMQLKISEGKIDFLESIIFSPKESVVISGILSDSIDANIEIFSHASNAWFFEHSQDIIDSHEVYDETIPIEEYLFRYNRGAFWMGKYVYSLFHIKENKLTRFLLNPLMHTRKLYDGLHDLKIMQNYFIQDVYTPLHEVIPLLNYCEENIGIFPIWICPVKSTQYGQKLSPHFSRDGMMYDIGIWGQTKKFLHAKYQLNISFEKYIAKHAIRKMLYAEIYYSKKMFWHIYDEKWYKNLRKKYFSSLFSDIWEKVHVSHRIRAEYIKGEVRFLIETIKGKNLNK